MPVALITLVYVPGDDAAQSAGADEEKAARLHGICRSLSGAWRLTNSFSAAKVVSLWVTMHRWPPPSTRRKAAPGTACATYSACEIGTIGSRSPGMPSGG